MTVVFNHLTRAQFRHALRDLAYQWSPDEWSPWDVMHVSTPGRSISFDMVVPFNRRRV